MTAARQQAPGPLYRSPWGLLPFQQKIVVECLVRPAALVVADTGLGKTHIDLATAALLFEGDEVDVHLLVCEQNKVDEWVEDFATYTDLRVARYYGTAAKRRKISQALTSDLPVKVSRTEVLHRPQVLISTYETFRNDIAVKAKVDNGRGRLVERLVPGFLAEALAGKRIVIGYDEMTKLGNRSSGIHKAHALLLDHVRKTGGSAKPLGLTATPIERSPENYYNLGRLLCPEDVGTVNAFERDHVTSWDTFGNYAGFKNLTPETTFEPWVTPLSQKMSGVLIRKRKSDDDVREQFPESVERFVHVDLGDRHAHFYDTILEVTGEDTPGLITVLRQVAGHPLSLLRSEGQLAKDIVATVGEEGLRALGSAKLDMLTDRLKPIVLGQGAQAVVFTFFGPSMIPLIHERLESEGISCALNYPAVGDKVRAEHKEAFKAGDLRVFLTSDAGARGINLPSASYVFEYESALTHSNRMQRFNRIHRIDSREKHGHDKVWFNTLVARGTVEDGLLDNALKRNQWADDLLEDDDPGEHFVTAAMRRRLLRMSRKPA